MEQESNSYSNQNMSSVIPVSYITLFSIRTLGKHFSNHSFTTLRTNAKSRLQIRNQIPKLIIQSPCMTGYQKHEPKLHSKVHSTTNTPH